MIHTTFDEALTISKVWAKHTKSCAKVQWPQYDEVKSEDVFLKHA